MRCQSSSSSALRRSRVRASRALNGSSSRRTSGSRASALAIATRWRIPPESVRGRALAASRAPDQAQQPSARAACFGLGQPASSRGSATLSAEDRHASRRGSWNTSPTRASGPVTGEPSIVTSPASGAMQTGQDAQQRALAAAVRTDERHDLARRDLERDGVERLYRRAPWNVRDTPLTRRPADGAGRVGARSASAGPLAVSTRPSSVARLARNGAGGAADGVPDGTCRPTAFFHPDCTVGSGRLGSRLASDSAVPRTSSASPLVGSSRNRGTLPPVGNRTLPRRLCRDATTRSACPRAPRPHRPTSTPRGGPSRSRLAVPRRSTQTIVAAGRTPAAERSASTASAVLPPERPRRTRAVRRRTCRPRRVGRAQHQQPRRPGMGRHPRPAIGRRQRIGLLGGPSELPLRPSNCCVPRAAASSPAIGSTSTTSITPRAGRYTGTSRRGRQRG